MTKDDAKQAYMLVSLYCSLYKSFYKKTAVVNRYREKWAMNDVVESVGYDRAKELLEYYFKTVKSGHPITWFFYNFEKLDASLKQASEDKKRRQSLLARTKLMVEDTDNEH